MRYVAIYITMVGAAGMLAGQTRALPPASPTQARALLDQYCVSCHNQKVRTAGLELDTADVNQLTERADIWEKVIRKVRGGIMPPSGLPRPDQPATNQFVSYLETTLDRAATVKPNPGRSLAHRLNRTEYGNAIRDLLALDIDPTELLPADDPGYGFDNIADLLGTSPVLLERYLSAAWKISTLAVGDSKIDPVVQTYRIPPELSQYSHIDGMPLGTRGGYQVTHNFPLDGEYVLHPALWKNTTYWVKGVEWENEFVILLDGKIIRKTRVGGGDDQLLMYQTTEAYKEFEKRMEIRVPVSAGPHSLTFTFLDKNRGVMDELVQPVLKDNIDQLGTTGMLTLEKITIGGPFKASGAGDTPARKKIFICRPPAGADELPCARRILSSLARKAYRSPATDAQMETLLEFFQKGRNEGKDFDTGIEYALTRILASPDFLFRIEADPANVKVETPYKLSDLELASRLSFFLWSSLPDEELLNIAAQGRLKNPAVFEQQVRRMMSDPKSEAMITNFAGQWLYLRNLKDIHPDQNQFPDFDENLRDALRKETELLVGSILREDRSVLDLLNADYTFINERLARHYGIRNVYGSHFRRMPVTDENRKGILGQGSFLTVSSYANRTSPVLRGKFILTNLLGTPPPPPPPNVPPLKDDAAGQPRTMKQRMEAHRANPSCAVCHRVMDPIGFSLENFNAVGQWRVADRGVPIDAADTMSDGTKVGGASDLRKVLLERREQFVGTLAEKLMIYALGRGVEAYDMPAIRAIVRDSAKDNYKFSSIILGIVRSVPFQMKLKKTDSDRPQVAGIAPGVPVR
jgi:hypothetical protein